MKKKKYEADKGLTGMGKDYSVYRMSLSESVLSVIIGAAAGTAVFCILFGSGILSAAAGAAGGVLGFIKGRKYFAERRNKELMRQFRDFLDSLAASLSSGQNISAAVESAHEDLVMLYGESSLMAEETEIIKEGMRNNMTAEELFDDFAARSGQRDIRTFSDTFCVCNRTGGNMREIILRTARILSEKMQTEKEIDVIASRGRNELAVMTAMPFIIVPMLKTLGESSASGGGTVTLAVRLAGAVIIAAAVTAGKKITEIKI